MSRPDFTAKKNNRHPPAIPNKDDGKLLHPRNKHRARYDFARLLGAEPALQVHIQQTPVGETTINFSHPDAVRLLNRAILLESYGIQKWDIPAHNLCPAVPGRIDYLHYLADVLAASHGGKPPSGSNIRALDIGTGASCIYPLLGSSEFGWQFVASDINPASLAHAQTILDANPVLGQRIELRLQTDSDSILKGIIGPDDWFDVSLCNPPFHASAAEAQAGSQRKWQNLGKPDNKAESTLNFSGHDAELWCPGGEQSFIERMIQESALMPTRCFWYTTLVSRSASLPAIHAALRRVKVQQQQTITMRQGNKESRLVAWTFLSPAQQSAWAKLRWSTRS
ncbi:23S rRNA (adenine(1618)-N(6))-methyltransferase RlmF [Undibacterium sp. SXout7W]|uniref:23S rRNA (adenine(1618)-N(6))-methyltransferase RlmF n=1 Tax=Undibacterium sp. SXout7W TaxID=3413049 RepID=UPI003BF34CCA